MKISKEIKTGILVVISLAIFVYGFNFLKGKDVFSSRDIYYAIYPQVSGIVESNPVQVNGFKVGRIKKIELLDTTGRLLVTMAISDQKLHITKGTVAKIVSSDLLGAKAIELVLGKSNGYVKDGDTLLSEIDPSLQESVNATIKPLKDKAEKLIASIDSIMLVVQAVLDKGTRENLNKSFESIKHALETFDRTAMRLDTMIASERYKLSIIFSKVESISSNLAANNDNISTAIKNFSAISDTLAKANISRTIENANKALSQVSGVMEKINKGEGSAGMLVHDDKLYKNLTSASGSLDSLLKDMDEHPKRYFSVFGRDKGKKKKK
ncbi:MAG: MCE family protein [Bacteroidetes bacterium]|nr:MCE family protein [Bacteroidota bacterium]